MENLFEEEQQGVEPTEGSETQSVSNSLTESVVDADGKPMANAVANAMANAIPEDSSNPRESVANDSEEPAETPPNAPEAPAEPAEQDTAETFPREYVEKLRKEAAGYRDRAKRADDLAQRLHTSLVEATGRLADARDLPYDESHLDDPLALSQAIEALLTERPHLASRKPMGNIGQGVAPVSNDVSLGGILRAGAM